MAAIRKHHSDAHMTLLTTKPFEDIARRCGYFDEIYCDSRPHILREPLKFFRLVNWLRSGKFQRVYDLQNSDRTDFYFFTLFGQNRPQWVGRAAGASHQNASPLRTHSNAFTGHVQTLGLAGINDIAPDDLSWLGEHNRLVPQQTPYILLVPSASARHPEKCWPAEHYADLCKCALAAGILPVLLGAQADHVICEKIHRDAQESLNLCGQTTFGDLADLARSAAGALGNDTGPLHIIAATHCPSLALFSSKSQPNRHLPLGAQVAYLQNTDLKNLPVDDVWARLQSILR
jgi:ADP-heptose:LPS heptosyltransferase